MMTMLSQNHHIGNSDNWIYIMLELTQPNPNSAALTRPKAITEKTE